MNRRRHTQAHFPALEPDEALRFVALLQRIIDAVWRAHGTEMAERLLDQHIADPLVETPQLGDGDNPF